MKIEAVMRIKKECYKLIWKVKIIPVNKVRVQVIKKVGSQWQVTMKLKGKRRDKKYNWKKKTEMIIKKSRIEN